MQNKAIRVRVDVAGPSRCAATVTLESGSEVERPVTSRAELDALLVEFDLQTEDDWHVVFGPGAQAELHRDSTGL